MQKLSIPAAILLFTSLLFVACKKKSVEPTTFAPPVKSITGVFNSVSSPLYGPQKNFSITQTYGYSYNANNQLLKAYLSVFNDFSLQTDRSSKTFTYTDNLLTKIDESSYLNSEFIYNGQKQIVTQNLYGSNGTLGFVNQLTYDGNGRIATFIYGNGMLLPNGTMSDPWTCAYNYSADGLLANIVITPKQSSAGTVYFSGYSDECDFDPLVMSDFINEVGFFPQVGLGSAKRLPLSIKYIFADGSGGDSYTFSYTINNHRIEKMTRSHDHINSDKTITNTDKYDFTFTYY